MILTPSARAREKSLSLSKGVRRRCLVGLGLSLAQSFWSNRRAGSSAVLAGPSDESLRMTPLRSLAREGLVHVVVPSILL
jgi:hypothetical protein